MKASVTNELKEHIDYLESYGVLTEDNRDDWHDIAFNRDFYIIGYYEADQWLKKHDIGAWEAIEYVTEEFEFHFGEVPMKPVQFNAEYIVNMLVYFAGMELV